MVYFVRLVSSGLIKIGYSGNVARRMQDLLWEHGPIELLASVDGTVHDEHAHHARFAALRVTGEWFEPSEALTSYVASLSSVDPVGLVAWVALSHEPLRADLDASPPLPAWLAGNGGAASRGLPLHPPTRRQQ